MLGEKNKKTTRTKTNKQKMWARVQMTQTSSLIGWIFSYWNCDWTRSWQAVMSNELSQRTIEQQQQKEQRFQLIFCRQHCSRTTQKSVSNGWVRESSHITASVRPRKVKYNYETQNLTNLEQLNTLNYKINITKVNVGCSAINAYYALNAHFPALWI